MKRNVLVIPLEEIERHFAANARQDVKVVAPEILGAELFEMLKAKGKQVKAEKILEGGVWTHAAAGAPNPLCLAAEFAADLASGAPGPFAISFANERAAQEDHYHSHHAEIYFSAHPLTAQYRRVDDARLESVRLERGGAIVFGPGVVHRVRLEGLALVIEVPAVADDRTLLHHAL